jgi:hypothetical protein
MVEYEIAVCPTVGDPTSLVLYILLNAFLDEHSLR